MSRDYIEPKKTQRYEIIELVDNGRLWYYVECLYVEKKYIFWGKEVEKKKPMKKFMYGPGGKGMNSTMYFKSLDEAQKAIAAVNSNSIKVVKEIEKYKMQVSK